VLQIGANSELTTYTGAISGGGSIVKIGQGTLTLGGTVANTYTGTTTVQEGTLEVQSIQRLGGDILIHGDAELRLGSGVTIDAGHAVSLTHLSPTGADLPGISVDEGAVATVNVGINEMVPDTKLHVSRGGTLVLAGNNTYTGGTVLEGGTLQITGKVRGRLVLVPGGFGDGSKIVLDVTNPPPTADGQLDDNADVEFHGGNV
jgi:autotransporter-associated beta strand protein